MPQPAFSANQDLLPSGTTAGTGTPIAVNHCSQISGHIKWSAGVTAGKVAIEIADAPGSAGTWQEIAGSDVAADGISGPQTVSWTYPFPAGAVRARVVTGVTGGSVQTVMNGLTGGR